MDIAKAPKPPHAPTSKSVPEHATQVAQLRGALAKPDRAMPDEAELKQRLLDKLKRRDQSSRG